MRSRYAGFFDKLGETMETFGGQLDYVARLARVFGHYVEVKDVSSFVIFVHGVC